MMRNSISLIFTGIMMACAIGAIPSTASAQAGSTPIRDPDHTFEKYACTWKQIKEANIVMQKRDYSCGAAALATILVYYWGDNVTEEKILLVIVKDSHPRRIERPRQERPVYNRHPPRMRRNGLRLHHRHAQSAEPVRIESAFDRGPQPQ